MYVAARRKVTGMGPPHRDMSKAQLLCCPSLPVTYVTRSGDLELLGVPAANPC